MSLRDGLIGVWCESANPWDDQYASGLTLTDNNTVGNTSGKAGVAGDFEDGNSESLSRADEALLSTGDIDFTIAVWLKAESLQASDNNYIASKGDIGSDNSEWGLLYRNNGAQNRFSFWINSASVWLDDSVLGAPSTGVWYYVQAQHDAANNLVRLRINNGAWSSLATGGTSPGSSITPFLIGALGISGAFARNWDGLINQFTFWKALKSDVDLNTIYNSGNGLAFSDWEPTIGRLFMDLAGTMKTAFKIGRATLDAATLTAARTLTIADRSGTVKLVNRAEEAAGKYRALRTLR